MADEAPSCSKAWQEWDAGLAKADAEFRERQLLSATQVGKTQHLMNQIKDDDRYMIVYPNHPPQEAKVKDPAPETHVRKRLGQLPRTLEHAEKILAEYKAEVLYNNDVVVSMWYLTWEHGFMGQGYGYQNKEKAFVRAATFILLWSAGFDVSSSDHLASHWAAKETS